MKPVAKKSRILTKTELGDWYLDIIKTVKHRYKYNINEVDEVIGMVFCFLAKANFPKCVRGFPNCTHQSAYNYMYTTVVTSVAIHVAKMKKHTEFACQLQYEYEENEWYNSEKDDKMIDLKAQYYFDTVEFYDNLDANFNNKEKNTILDLIRDPDCVKDKTPTELEIIKQRLIDMDIISEEEAIQRQRNTVLRKRKKQIK